MGDVMLTSGWLRETIADAGREIQTKPYLTARQKAAFAKAVSAVLRGNAISDKPQPAGEA